MKKIRVAVVGYGHLGKWHCQKVDAYKDKVEFVAIVEKSPFGQEAAMINHPTVKVVTDIKEIIQEIDAAFVVTPTSTHFHLVKYLMENDKHVFCEKPLCSNDDEATELKRIAHGRKIVLQIGHSERFHEAWDRLRNKFLNLKPPFTVRINRSAPFKGRATDVDVVQDLAIHDLDLVLHLFKQKPVSVMAHGFTIRTTNWDHASIHLKLEDNCEVSMVVGRNHVKEMRDIEVISQDGLIMVDLLTNKILEASSSTFDDGSFVKEEPYIKRDHLMLEHDHFYQSIILGRPAIIGLRDGMNAVHLVDCTLKSMATLSAVMVKLV